MLFQLANVINDNGLDITDYERVAQAQVNLALHRFRNGAIYFTFAEPSMFIVVERMGLIFLIKMLELVPDLIAILFQCINDRFLGVLLPFLLFLLVPAQIIH